LRETNVIPVIFVLLPNKTKIIYTRLFELIKEYIPNYDPNKITIDFETIHKLLMMFSLIGTQISVCNYRLNQYLEKVQNTELVDEYNRYDEEI